tara:strand:+ start:2029 stop:2271 length:243 start_codon:yes stop_codon:yes gene_type:complete
MGDMAEVFNAMKQHKKESRAARFEAANDEGWEKHSDHHWYRIINGKKMNYWPSSGLVMIGKKRMNINGKRVKEMLAKESK